MENAPRKRILILGGGFAGLSVAMALEKKLTQDPPSKSPSLIVRTFSCSHLCFTRWRPAILISQRL